MRTLYVLFRLGGTTPLWSAVTTAEEAEDVAVRAAVNHGNVQLLSGPDLLARLEEAAAA